MHLCRWPWPNLPPTAENVLLVCAPAWCCYVDVWRPYCHWAHIHLSVLVATPGNRDVFGWALTDSHTWVHDLFSVRCWYLCLGYFWRLWEIRALVACALENLRTGPFPHHSPQGRADPLPWRCGPSCMDTGEPASKSQGPWENWLYCWLPQRESWCHPSLCIWERWSWCHVLGISGLDPHLRVTIPMESWTDWLSYYPNPHSRLWIGPPQHIPYLWPAEAHEVISVLWNHISRIFMTLGKRRISEKSLDEGCSMNGVS